MLCGRVALALDAGLAKEAASKLEQYIQIKTSSSPASLEALTPAQLEAAARMYALEVHRNRSFLYLPTLFAHSRAWLQAAKDSVELHFVWSVVM